MYPRNTSGAIGRLGQLSARAAVVYLAVLGLALPLAATAQTNVAPGGNATQSGDWVNAEGAAAAQPLLGGLPLGQTLLLSGSANQKMRTFWDGPGSSIKKALKLLRAEGFKRSKVPFICGISTGGPNAARIRFDSGEVDRFELTDRYGRVVTGSFERSGADGETIKLTVDRASKRSLKKILEQSAVDCLRFEDDSKEKLLTMNVKLRDFELRGKIQGGERFVLTGKLTGIVKWKRKAKKLGKIRGSGSTIHKFRLEAPLDQAGSSIPGACLADQGEHIYPDEGAQFQGWIELAEKLGTDRFYLILSDDFISILRDFQEDFQSVRALLALVDSEGSPCNSGGRTQMTVELTEFGKNNFLFVIETLESLESNVTAFAELVEDEVNKVLAKIAAGIIASLTKIVIGLIL